MNNPNNIFFQNFDKHNFEDWLRVGLEEYLLKDKCLQAFPGAADEIVRYNFPAEAIDSVYRKLSPNQQSNFRLAVANLINSWEITKENFVILEHLLHLASLLPAKEILRGLSAWLRLGYLKNIPDELAIKLFDQVFLTVSRLTAPIPEAAQCLRELIAFKLFHNELAGMALEALWVCDSTNIINHFDRLRPYLSILMAGKNNRPQIWAKRILNQIGLYNIVQVLPSLIYLDQTDNDTWLVNGLLAHDNPILECWINNDDKLNFQLTGQQDTKESILIQDWSDLYLYLRCKNLMKKPLNQDKSIDPITYQKFIKSLDSNTIEILID